MKVTADKHMGQPTITCVSHHDAPKPVALLEVSQHKTTGRIDEANGRPSTTGEQCIWGMPCQFGSSGNRTAISNTLTAAPKATTTTTCSTVIYDDPLI